MTDQRIMSLNFIYLFDLDSLVQEYCFSEALSTRVCALLRVNTVEVAAYLSDWSFEVFQVSVHECHKKCTQILTFFSIFAGARKTRSPVVEGEAAPVEWPVFGFK
jgi:hypothetical protein